MQNAVRRMEGTREQPKFAIRNLSSRYGSHQVLKEVSLDIEERKITALIGPSGCGKTTLLRTLNRLNDLVPGYKAEGQVLLDGQDIYRDVRSVTELRRRVGMLFQRPNPFPQSILNNVTIGPRIHGLLRRSEREERAEQLLQQVGLWNEVKDKLHHSPFSLSGGQQQRLCLARALAVEPEVLLLDEPTSALDPISTEVIEELFRDLKKRTTLIIVTHNLLQARRLTDVTVFMLGGECIEANTTEELLAQPRDIRTAAYLNGRVEEAFA